MEQEKRGLRPYQDKQYLLADLSDGRPNPHPNAYDHRDLSEEENLVADQRETTTEIIIWHTKMRFVRKHACLPGASNSLAF